MKAHQMHVKLEQAQINYIKKFCQTIDISYNKFVLFCYLRRLFLSKNGDDKLISKTSVTQRGNGENLHIYIDKEILCNIKKEIYLPALNGKYILESMMYHINQVQKKKIDYPAMSKTVTVTAQVANQKVIAKQMRTILPELSILIPKVSYKELGQAKYKILIQPGEWLLLNVFNPDIKSYNINNLLSGIINYRRNYVIKKVS